MQDRHDVKQRYRRKQANSLRGSDKLDDRRRQNRGKKASKVILDATTDFHPNDNRCSKECSEVLFYSREISMDSDNNIHNEIYESHVSSKVGIRFSSVTSSIFPDQKKNTIDLTNWLKTEEMLEYTPFNVQDRPSCVPYECYSIDTVADDFVYEDLKRAYNNPSSDILLNIIRYLETFPCHHFNIHTRQFYPAIGAFRLEYQLTDRELLRCYDICTLILKRASYGVLFLKDDQFLAVTNRYGQQNRSAVKGHPTLKPNGTWEEPWETAVREVKEELQYRHHENQKWRPYDMEEHKEEYEHLRYLECLVASYQNDVYDRLIGLYVIRLKNSIEFQSYGEEVLPSSDLWYSIDNIDGPSGFYTIYPFIKYIRNFWN